MKVLHLCLASFFPDGYSYQENLLPKFHKQQGHQVEVIASLFTFDKDGKGTYMEGACSYNNEYGIPVTRLDYKKPLKLFRILRKYLGFKEALEASAPDIIFVHGCQFMDIKILADYAKAHPGLRVFVDNHADFSNSAKNFLTKNILHRIIWRHYAHVIEPYAEKFYGVLPVRVDFLRDMYGLPAEKCELLVMGADDEAVEKARDPQLISEIRSRYSIAPDDFLVMTGGKIDLFKTQTLLLMEAVRNIENPRLKLIVFGSVVPELKEKLASLADGKKVQYIGWVQSADSYKYFSAADLVVFPGRHSVFWEQVTGQGKPMLVKDWPGTHHVDLGGNVRFLTQDSTEEIQGLIEELLNNPQEYEEMKKVAGEKGMKVFSYDDIARRCIK